MHRTPCSCCDPLPMNGAERAVLCAALLISFAIAAAGVANIFSWFAL